MSSFPFERHSSWLEWALYFTHATKTGFEQNTGSTTRLEKNMAPGGIHFFHVFAKMSIVIFDDLILALRSPPPLALPDPENILAKNVLPLS